MAEPLSQPADLGARQGPRAGGAEPRRGRLGGRRLGRARLAGSVAGLSRCRREVDGGRARQAGPGGARQLSPSSGAGDPIMEPIIGIIGCGNISDLKGAARSQLIRVKSCADLNAEAARTGATRIAAVPVDALLADPDIEIVINLTVPLAHGPVSRQIITAGKHVYSEKPLAARFTEAQALMLAAAGRGVRVGCAPIPSSAPRIRPVGGRSTAGGSGGRSPARRPCCRTGWSTGTPIPSSSSSTAAARSTMSGRTTSPSWSTSSGRSSGSPPRPRPPAPRAP